MYPLNTSQGIIREKEYLNELFFWRPEVCGVDRMFVRLICSWDMTQIEIKISCVYTYWRRISQINIFDSWYA